MPAIVSSYIERETFEGSLDLQHQLLVDYENDIVKYAQGLDKAKILSVYRSIPAQLAKENKKFQYSKVSKGGRSKDHMGCVEWLKDAGLINVCECLQFPELPLKGNVDESKYKVYISDTGLLVASLDDESQIDLRANKNLGIYKGAFYENFAAEVLVKQGYGLYYYSKDNSTPDEAGYRRDYKNRKEIYCASADKDKSAKKRQNRLHLPDLAFLFQRCFTTDNLNYFFFTTQRFL